MGNMIAKYVFYPPPEMLYTDEEAPIHIKTKHGETVRAFEAIRTSPRGTIIYSHGNADCIAMPLRIYDYIGYGRSTGTVSEKNTYRSIDAVYHYCLDRGDTPDHIILWGTSLGSGPTVDLAARTAGLGGVVLQSPLLSCVRVVYKSRFTLPIDMFCNCDKIKKVVCPVFVIHGRRDEVVPFWHGEELHRRMGESAYPPLWIEGAGHNDIENNHADVLLIGVSELLAIVLSGPEDKAGLTAALSEVASASTAEASGPPPPSRAPPSSR